MVHNPNDHEMPNQVPRTGQFARDDLAKMISNVQLPPRSRFRARADGGRDATYRINFKRPLTPEAIQQIYQVLLEFWLSGRERGIVALTKVEFIEPDTCEYRFWFSTNDDSIVTAMFELSHRIHLIEAIYTIDGIRYPEEGS